IIGMFDQFMWRYRDPDRATTAIGSIRQLKRSDRIMLRVNSEQRLQTPLYLREASYDRYNYGIWNNETPVYTLIDQRLDGSWLLEPGNTQGTINVTSYMPREIGVIPVPHGVNRIKDITALEINTNQYGAVRMEIREGWINFNADYQDRMFGSPPGKNDLDVPSPYRNDFDRLAMELDLYSKTPEESLALITRFFTENFTYSLDQRRRYPRSKFLQNFLFNTRSGHCEYFATSTVLLLRTLGIPARYAVGYVVDEFSNIEDSYIARSRDAHSWALAFVNDEWRIVETTPSVWAPYEDANASLFEPFMDIYSWLSYRYALFQARDELEQEETNYDLLYLLIPLVLFLIWRLFFKQRINKNKAASIIRSIRRKQGVDSVFYMLINEFKQAGYARRDGETLSSWMNRINEKGDFPELEEALQLHYQYRFDPATNGKQIQKELTRRVKSILKRGISPVSAHPLNA
ncbi:MAG: transglutaminase domain-containing protein, partial [Gammaproteobacteria bacterium]|nr:transglutaminase domain-containing protein [Gammaproteobacteria bacterium]